MFERRPHEVLVTADIDPEVSRKIDLVSEAIGLQKNTIAKDAIEAWLDGRLVL